MFLFNLNHLSRYAIAASEQRIVREVGWLDHLGNDMGTPYQYIDYDVDGVNHINITGGPTIQVRY